jgi:hypothetical protein
MNAVGEVERAVFSGIFASRVSLAKLTVDEAVEQAKTEHKKTLAWVASDSTKVRSFRWFCDLFDLEYTAVRRAIQERRK